jgi:hypothetical protein
MKDTVEGSEPLPLAAIVDPMSPDTSPVQGVMTTWLCNACGHTEWYASDAKLLRHPRYVLGTTGDPCSGCGGSPRIRIQARERAQSAVDTVDRPVAIRVSMWGWRPLGNFEMRVCTTCGLTEWMALGIEELREDEHACVNRLVGGEMEGRGGPYR